MPVRLAWFSPLPPSTSGIAAYSAELLPLLRRRGHDVEPFTADSVRDFVWTSRRRPFDLCVYQLGNAACHDFMWAYLFRHPGLVVLHDAQLHQARALWLTRRWRPRRDDYLAELRANHPEAPEALGTLVVAGLGGSLYHHWPLVRLVVERARVAVVHNRTLEEDLRARHPSARIRFVPMGVADPELARTGRDDATGGAGADRAALGLSDRDVVVAAFGGVTPEKRIGAVIQAIGALATRHPNLHLLLVGGEVPHYSARADAERWRVADRVHLTGFVSDDDLPRYLRAADICACLRWPTNRETSASWLRCLAAGRATIVTDLAHMVEVPTIDPRGWRVLDVLVRDEGARPPVAVSLDLLDEQHSLQLAIDRLVEDTAAREALGSAARAWWHEHHRLERMAAAYDSVIAEATTASPARRDLPPHLLADGSEHLRAIAGAFGGDTALRDLMES